MLTNSGKILIVLVLILSTIGLIVVLSASSITSIDTYSSQWTIFSRQLMWMIVGVFLMSVVALKIPFSFWRKISRMFLVAVMVLLVLVIIPGVATPLQGATRWIGYGMFNVQPSELMKLALVVFGADFLDRRSNYIDNWRYSVVPLTILTVIAMGLVVKEPDLGTSIVLAVILMSLLTAAGVNIKVLITMTLSGIVSVLILAVVQPYRFDRLLTFIHPFANSSTSGYQMTQSLIALGSGHIFGVGLGASASKWGFLPNPQTDFIFAVIGQESGLIGSLIVIALFGIVGFMGYKIAKEANDNFTALLAVGITTWITSQAVINIGGVIGALPVTGIPLPLVSFGGSSLVAEMTAFGILLAISRSSKIKKTMPTKLAKRIKTSSGMR